MQTYSILIFILVKVAAVAIAANRTGIPAAILLVLVGLVLSVTSGLPRVELSPELVLLLVVPPLIYSAGVAMSWREFRYNIRSISLLAFGGVTFTTVAVAAVVHYLLDWDWSVGFVLGAIISPPDEVAPLAIARRLGLPRRTMVVIEGEGLANDATALILYRFAVAAVAFGTFSFGSAVLVFVAIIAFEIAFGLAVGFASLRLRRWARDPRVEIILSLLTPFAAYWPPQALGGSGVLATVVCGLYISWNGPLLIPSHTRLQGIFFWDLFIYLLEGGLFLLTGLEARPLLDRIDQVTAGEFAMAALVTTVAVIAARFMWVFPSLYLPRLLIPSVRRAVLLRRPRDRLARCRAGAAADDRVRHAIPPPRPDPAADLLGHSHHFGRPGPRAPAGAALARSRQDRRGRAEGGTRRRDRRAPLGDRRGVAPARPTRRRAKPAGAAGRAPARAPSGAAQPLRTA
jgi:Na+/H+ antiporter